MARLKIIYHHVSGKKMAEFKDGELVWHSDEYAPPGEVNASMVMGDIEPYRSQIDGSMIMSRSQHRSHLRDNNCIEIGNETKYLKNKPVTPPSGLKERLIAVANEKLRYT